MTQSAALAFYALLALPGTLLAATSIAGAVFGRRPVRTQIVADVDALVGSQAAELTEDLVRYLGDSGPSRLAGVLGLVVLVFAATSFLVQLQEALDRVWEVQRKRAWSLRFSLKQRALSLALLLTLSLTVLVYVASTLAVSTVRDLVEPAARLELRIFGWIDAGFLAAALLLLLTMTYKLLPSADVAWRQAFRGAVVSTLLFLGGRHLISLWLERSTLASAYSAAGSLALLLLWVYYSSLLLLLGAELSRLADSEVPV